ncbi:B12-binding domain-containing radical SAM protein [Desulfosporosinus nitroreducens]|uniref:B12-binding domain-containing radical SAM protein n=1 Tax=Desulfosporosinus nitroreducens TaxID=2018668 RepID=A0ABT8QQH9_9FIRM|nr:radical SAM protein [Desulfosporosinus nitroreducens]MCO1600690.1 B12-binding domain-containing radical SAM protein [Desulfosporosinus nitroreducens]MDO0822348.1 B12-binding domain-containing radical SAM protein [Desulfosporosinus nitroreducens]
MKVMLIQPPSSTSFMDKVYMYEPLGLEYLGAGLKEDGHEVLLLDARIEPDIEVVFRSFQPDIVGITGYTSHLTIIKNMAIRFKEINSEVYIIIGGHHATVRPKDYNVEGIDLVVVGEGVFTLREVIKHRQLQQSLDDIPGLAIPGIEMKFTKDRPYTNLDDLPFPDRSLTAQYRELYFSDWMKPLASIRTSLGCFGRCNFCALWSITGGKYLQRQPERIVEELQNIQEDYVFFCDDESMCDTRRMDNLADLIRESGIRKKYFLYGRVDTIVKNPDLFAKWKEIGLTQVFVGFESFSDTRLKELNKEITVEQQKQAVKILNDLKVDIYAAFVIDPSFTRQEFNQLIDYVTKLNVSYAALSILTPLPGTKLFEQTEHQLIAKDPEFFDFMHTVLPTTLPLEEFYSEYARTIMKSTPTLRYLKYISKFNWKRRLPIMKDLLGVVKDVREGYKWHLS